MGESQECEMRNEEGESEELLIQQFTMGSLLRLARRFRIPHHPHIALDLL
jgi:hypothetical protein